MMEITATEQNIEKRMKSNEDRLRDFCDSIKCTKHLHKGPKEKREKRDLRKYLKR